MNTFNKKSLCVALAATGMLGAAGVAQAVNVSENGLGNVLIYPYYTVNKDINGNSFNTLMSVVNTTLSTKAIKVRFREGRNSVEVLDFNVFLSPYDVWTAAITPTAAGGGQIATSDKSCTIPPFPAGGVDFRTLSLESTDNAVTRTSEGYFEVFEMATYEDDDTVAINAKHSNGVPKDCTKINDTVAANEADSVQGGLFGGVTILSPAGGGAWSQSATALANFTTGDIYASTGSTSPSYNDADDVSNVIVGSELIQSSWDGSGVDAVSAVLMANAVTNEYVLDTGSKSQTSWILTFPTKFEYVNGTGAPFLPFTDKYVTKVGACEPFYGIVFDREEASPEIITGTDFSPQPKPGAGPSLCWEAQSVGFGTSNVFGSANHANVSTTNPSSGDVYRNGWAVFAFNNPADANEHFFSPDAGASVIIDLTGNNGPQTGATVTYYGLPVIGFAAQTFQNDAVVVNGQTYLSTFGVDFSHHFERSLNPLKIN